MRTCHMELKIVALASDEKKLSNILFKSFLNTYNGVNKLNLKLISLFEIKKVFVLFFIFRIPKTVKQ